LGEGEVFGKEVINQVRKDFAEPYEPFGKKGPRTNPFTANFQEE
jgi:hypothetical protein